MKSRKTPAQIIPKMRHVQTTLDHGQVMEVLLSLQQKVLASPALNGGFDTLLFKVDKIEESQVQMGVKVDSIHEAIYHPDEGLFARVKDVEHIKKKTENVEKLEKDVLILQQCAESEEKTVEKKAKLTEEHEKLIRSHGDQLKELIEFKKRMCAIVKWGMVTIGGGLITGIVKLFYDFTSGHITIH